MLRKLPLLIVSAAVLCGQESRVFRFVHIREAQSFMEAATVIRSVAEIRELKVDAGSGSMALSGAQWQMELAAWLFDRLDRNPTDPPSPIEKYEVSGVADPSVRISLRSPRERTRACRN